MGEQADYLTEQGLDMLILHKYGECEDWCEMCDEEEKLLHRISKFVSKLADKEK
jgi:hypothetical protein